MRCLFHLNKYLNLNLSPTFNPRRLAFFLLIGLLSAADAAVPPIPKGIFCMPGSDATGIPDEILNDPRIIGVDIGGSWGTDLETTEGQFDWSSIDSEIAQAESHGKKILLRIVAGGVNTPAWVMANPNVQIFSFVDPNPYHKTFGQVLKMPVYWDPIFLQKKLAMIAATGAHLAGHSSIEVVACSFANSMTGDWSIPDSPEDIANWRAIGYTSDAMVNAGKLIIDATMAAFPNQNVTLSVGRGPGDLDPSPNYLARTAIDYATSTYGRFITQKNSLSASTVDPSVDASSLSNWQVLFDQTPNVAAQMLWFVTGDSTYRMNGGIPGDEAAVLLNAITIGAHYGTQYQEIYESDLKNPALSSVIDTAYNLLSAPPPPPTAPTDAQAVATSLSRVDLTWNDNANNELGYRVESKLGVSGTYELVSTFGPDVRSVSITSLLEGTQYYYRVLAVNAGGVSAYSNEASATTVLTAPASLNAQASSSSEVVLTWADRSASESGFTIERSPLTDTSYAPIATVGANTTSFTDSGLSESTKYWYRVRAYNADTTSAYASEKQATTLHDLPAAPSALGTTSVLPDKVSLSWKDNSDNESGFKIQRKEGATGTFVDIRTTVANATAYTDNDKALKDGTLYFYRVSASNSAGDSAFSSEVAATTILKSPDSLTAQAVSSSQVSLTWSDRSAAETGYTIERSPVTNTSYTAIATVNANTTSFTDSGLAAATKYWYRVRAFNPNATSDYAKEKSATTLNDLPAAPTGLSITSLLTNKVSVAWKDNSNNESGFRIQRKEGATGTFADIRTTVANVTAYTDNDKTLKDGTSYSYRVCAKNSAGDSAYSEVVSGVTALKKPTSTTATAKSSVQIDLSWLDNSNSETAYKIERKMTAAGTFTQIAQVGANVRSYSDTTGLQSDTRYYYRVRATSGATDSDYSNEPFAVTFE